MCVSAHAKTRRQGVGLIVLPGLPQDLLGASNGYGHVAAERPLKHRRETVTVTICCRFGRRSSMNLSTSGRAISLSNLAPKLIRVAAARNIARKSGELDAV